MAAVVALVIGLAQTGSAKPFLDQKKTLVPQQEWNREVVAKRGGIIRFEIDSQGPFAITVMTDSGHKALLARNQAGFRKSDILLTKDIAKPSWESTVTLPPGSSWLLIENYAKILVHIRLRCSAP